jgi:hypothetical protein
MNQQASFSRESIEIRFRCHAKKESGKGLLFEFLQNDEIFTSKEMILQAIKAYWMPVAMAKTTHFSEEEIEYVGLRAIQELRRQIDEIAFLTGVQLNTNMSEKEVITEVTPLSQASKNQEIAFKQDVPFADLGL